MHKVISNLQNSKVLRRSGAFQSPKSARNYWLILLGLLLVSLLAAYGLIAYQNPMPAGSHRFWLVAQRRSFAVTAMAVVAVCQAFATIAFQTVTQNKIITPGVMGFQSLYTAIHTATVYFFGIAGLMAGYSLGMFVFQLLVMVGFSLLLYSWLLTGKRANMHSMLLVGIVLGGGLGSASTFMQRMLTPSQFDVLTARLFGSVNNAAAEYYPVALPLVAGAVILLYALSRKLNVLALGQDSAMNLGVSHRKTSVLVLVLVSILMAVSTALVGPMMFLGFLVAMLTYQLADTFDHRFLFPLASLMAFMVLTVSYFLMKYIFSAQGVVSIIIELVGGLVFLIVILRKGKL